MAISIYPALLNKQACHSRAHRSNPLLMCVRCIPHDLYAEFAPFALGFKLLTGKVDHYIFVTVDMDHLALYGIILDHCLQP